MAKPEIPPARETPLSADAAFVVHLASTASAERDCVCGRIEHIDSGRSTRFASVGELLAFMHRIVDRTA